MYSLSWRYQYWVAKTMRIFLWARFSLLIDLDFIFASSFYSHSLKFFSLFFSFFFPFSSESSFSFNLNNSFGADHYADSLIRSSTIFVRSSFLISLSIPSCLSVCNHFLSTTTYLFKLSRLTVTARSQLVKARLISWIYNSDREAGVKNISCLRWGR